MHRTARHSAILTEATNAGSCTVADLARRLDVSGETIRRDIKRMASQGLLRKVRGGAQGPAAVAFVSQFRVRTAFLSAGAIEAIDMLITDDPPPPALADRLDEAEVVVEVAG